LHQEIKNIQALPTKYALICSTHMQLTGTRVQSAKIDAFTYLSTISKTDENLHAELTFNCTTDLILIKSELIIKS
jgi:hypothetical protein